MDTSKTLTVACGVLLPVCLVLSITSLTALRSTVRENEELKKIAAEATQEYHDCIENITSDTAEADGTPSAEDLPTQTTAPAEAFCLKEANGRIAVFTSDGYLVRFLEVSLDTLPPADREALRVGITVGSWRELMSVIQDYTS